jgi:hypothetical protein
MFISRAKSRLARNTAYGSEVTGARYVGVAVVGIASNEAQSRWKTPKRQGAMMLATASILIMAGRTGELALLAFKLVAPIQSN